jgi:hypothetical protein
MNIENIKTGMIVKNYKEMCKLLDEDIKAGKSKTLQDKEWKRYFSYQKEGNKFIVNEIFQEPKPKVDLRKNGNNTIYGDIIQKLILDLLVQGKNNGSVFLSTNKLLRALSMINSNYSYCKENVPRLSKFIQIDESNIYEFYDTTHGNLKRSLETSLNQLKSKSLIFWKPCITVCMKTANIDTNEFGDIKIDKIEHRNNKCLFTVDSTIHEEHRRATSEEIEIILEVEKDIMNEMNYDSKSDIVIHRAWKQFQKKVNEILFDRINILYYYESYEIICNRKHILIELNGFQNLLLNDSDRKELKTSLNNTVSSKLHSNAINRKEKVKNKIDECTFGQPELTDADILRDKHNYLINNEKLIDTLINEKHNNIIKKVRDTNLDDNNVKYKVENVDEDKTLGIPF